MLSREQRLALGNVWAHPPYRTVQVKHRTDFKPKLMGSGIAQIPTAGVKISPLEQKGGGTAFHSPCDIAGQTVSDGGGSKLQYAQILYFFWGSAWNNPNLSPGVGDIFVAIRGLDDGFTNPNTNYFSGLMQYGVGGPGGQGPLAGGFMASGPPVIIPTDPPNNPFSLSDVTNEMNAVLNDSNLDIQLGLNKPQNEWSPANLFVVFMPPGLTASGPFGEHSFTTDQYGYRWPFAYISYGSLATMTYIFFHELIESMTDPYGDAWQVNPRNSGSWNEICDQCCSGSVLNGVTVTSYFSATDNACIIPSPPPPSPPLLAPGDYLIDCVTKVQHRSSGIYYISKVGGPGISQGRWLLSDSDVVNLINGGLATFYTLEGGRRANVIVERWYLKTVADDFTPNNLDNLPSC